MTYKMKTKEELDHAFDKAIGEAEAKLKPKLTPEFLATLIAAVEADWSGDYIEISSFAERLFDLADTPMPKIKYIGEASE